MLLTRHFCVTKPLIIALGFFITFSPVAPVFAQEVEISTELSQQSEQPALESDVINPEIVDEVSKLDESKQTNEEKPIEEDPEMSMMMGSDSPQVFPSIAASTIKHQLPQSDVFSGALVYSYPIVVPPGRNGLQPDLALSYNNQQVLEDTVWGMGWNMNIPSIERINRKGSEKLYTENYYQSSISGELVYISSTSYKAKVETGDFLTYTFGSNTWTVKDKQGVTYTFGSSAAGRQDDPNDSSRIYKWMLQEVRDLNDNYIKYEYYKDAGQIYPSKVIYTGTGSTDGVFEVEFLRETRLDTSKVYKTGFAVTTNKRIYEIQTKVNGSWVKKYAIAYANGDNAKHSLINTITETGRDEVTSASVSLPATDFDYQVPQDTISLDTNWSLPIGLSNNNDDTGVRMLDVNNDGLTDILKFQKQWGSGPHNDDVYINNGTTGWALDTNWTVPSTFFFSNYNGSSEGGQIADVNGDNLPDLLIGTPSNSTKKVYIHNGSGWAEDTNWVLPIYLSDSNLNYDSAVRIVDVNGDGLTDLLKIQNGSTPVRTVYLNNGSGWTQDTTWTYPTTIYFAHNNGSSEGGKYADLNGDGLVDLFQRTQSRNEVFFNTGKGWELDSNWSVPVQLSGSQGEDLGVRYADINGDGLLDFVRMFLSGSTQYRNVYLNNGLTGWTEDTNWTLPTDAYVLFSSSNGDDLKMRIGDVNGDALYDLMYRAIGSSTNKVFPNQGKRAELLSRITYPRGGRTDITYKPSTQYFNGSTKLNPNLPFALDTVYQIANYDGISVTATYTYSYEGGKYYYVDGYDRKFSGFSKATKADSAGNKTVTYFHQGDSTNSSQGEYSDDISKAGKVYRVEVTDSSNNVYQKIINKWENYDLGNGNDFVKLTQQIDFTYDGDSDHKDKAYSYTYDNGNGNLTEKIDWGEVTGADAGTFTDTGSDKFTTTVSYVSNSTYHIYGLPSQETVVDQSSAKVRESKYYYDAQSAGSALKGNLTKEEQWKTSTTYIDIEHSYNSYGLVTQDKDPRDKTTDYTYDSYYLYPATVTNALSQATSYTYDYSVGKPKQVTDSNTRVFQTVFDGLDRVIEEKQPDLASPSSLLTKSTYAYSDLSVGASTLVTSNLDGSTSVVAYSYTDGFDRPIQTRTEVEDSNTYAVTDTIYNNIEQVHKQSLPYSSTGTTKTSPTTTSTLLSLNNYDPLLRITTVVNAIGTVTNAYDDWKHSITDLRGKTKHLYQDAYGRLVRVDEINSSNTYSTYYTYNGNGNLTNITDALSNVRNFTYDALGRRLTAQDLHASADTYFGTWTYTYDDAGNITTVVDPNSQTINYTYDDVNRVLTEDYTGQGGTETTYTYDSGTDGVGRLTTVTATGATTAYLYDALGNTKRETKTINSTAYQTDYTFDRLGNVLTITNPDSSQVKYTYNTAGQMETVQRKESTDGSYINVVTDIDYGIHGAITNQAFANGSATTNTYDATKLYRLSTKVTTITGGNKVQDLTYTMDNNGNITQIVDASNTASSKTVDYGYDDLNRLTSAAATNVASGQSTYSQTYAYDAIGNFTSKSDQGSYTYAGNTGTSYANPHAVTSIGSTNYTYDNNGNMLTVTGGLSNTWNFKNQLTQAVIGSVTTTYAYDHAGQRVKYGNGTNTTVYASKGYNTDGTTPVKHIYAGSTLVATVKGTGASAAVFSVHNDHLSGSNAVTNSGGTQEEIMDYFPFGDIRIDQKAGSFDEQRKFAGHEFDAETELSYMNARYYKSDIGRFVSQDPAFLLIGDNKQFTSRYQRALEIHLINPQSLNSYTYVNNNPTTYRDATGEILPTIIGLGIWGIVEVGLSMYDAYSTYETVTDPNASWGEKAGTAILFGLGAFAPGGGYGLIDDAAKGLIKNSDSASSLLNKSLKYNWSNPDTLKQHFLDHGADFGAKNADEYAAKASDFFNNGQNNSSIDRIVGQDGVIRMYDSKTNTFGSYTSDGATKTYFKPTGGDSYWQSQKADPIKNVSVSNN